MQVALDRYDLHHAHLFLSHRHRRLGLLFHSKEYPAHHPDLFPVHLGNCQRRSALAFNEREMDFRNILWSVGLGQARGGRAGGDALRQRWPSASARLSARTPLLAFWQLACALGPAAPHTGTAAQHAAWTWARAARCTHGC